MSLFAAGGPEIAVHGWPSALVVIGAVAGAIAAIYRFLKTVIVPLAVAVAEIKKDYPVWTQIAERFVDERGGETISAELRALAANDEVSAANQQAMMLQLNTVIDKANGLDEKLSETRHQIIGDFATMGATLGGARSIVQALVDTSKRLSEVHQQLEDLAGRIPPPST